MMAKELVPVIFSCAAWDPLLTRRPVEFQYDNLSHQEGLLQRFNSHASTWVPMVFLGSL